MNKKRLETTLLILLQSSYTLCWGQIYLLVFWTPTLCLVGGDENVGGDEECSVLGRRHHVVRFVPHSVKPGGIQLCFSHRYAHPKPNEPCHTLILGIFRSMFIVKDVFYFKPVAAIFHTGCCPLHLHEILKNIGKSWKMQTDKQGKQVNGKRTIRRTDFKDKQTTGWADNNKRKTIRQSKKLTNGLILRPPSVTFVITLDSTGAASW